MGCNEFTILLGELQENAEARVVAEKLISVVNEPVLVGEYRCKVGLSLGNSRFPQNTRNADSLLRLADDAM